MCLLLYRVQVPQVLTVTRIGQLYMSNVTIQGDGQTGRRDATQALYIPEPTASVFAEGENLTPVCTLRTRVRIEIRFPVMGDPEGVDNISVTAACPLCAGVSCFTFLGLCLMCCIISTSDLC